VTYVDNRDFVDLLSDSDYRQFIETLESSSHFGGSSWAHKAMAVAERMMNKLPKDDLLRARIELRQICMRRVFSSRPGNELCYIGDTLRKGFSPVDARSNAYWGEAVLSDVQVSIELDDLDYAWCQLEDWKLFRDGHPSTMEKEILLNQNFFRVKILRFRGRFGEAAGYFPLLCPEQPNGGSLFAVNHHMAVILCELGEFDKAIMNVKGQLKILTERGCLDHGKGKRMKRANAEIHLMKCIWLMKNGHSSASVQDMLQTTRPLYTELMEIYKPIVTEASGKSIRRIWYIISVGLAIIDHIESRLHTDVSQQGLKTESALSSWKSILPEAKNWRGPSFAAVVVYASMRELELRRGNVTESDSLALAGESIFQRTGRQSFYAVLPTWYDLVSMWVSESNKSARRHRDVVQYL
jgi:hypothetical protein